MWMCGCGPINQTKRKKREIQRGGWELISVPVSLIPPWTRTLVSNESLFFFYFSTGIFSTFWEVKTAPLDPISRPWLSQLLPPVSTKRALKGGFGVEKEERICAFCYNKCHRTILHSGGSKAITWWQLNPVSRNHAVPSPHPRREKPASTPSSRSEMQTHRPLLWALNYNNFSLFSLFLQSWGW